MLCWTSRTICLLLLGAISNACGSAPAAPLLTTDANLAADYAFPSPGPYISVGEDRPLRCYPVSMNIDNDGAIALKTACDSGGIPDYHIAVSQLSDDDTLKFKRLVVAIVNINPDANYSRGEAADCGDDAFVLHVNGGSRSIDMGCYDERYLPQQIVDLHDFMHDVAPSSS